jgi:hypothetical protein
MPEESRLTTEPGRRQIVHPPAPWKLRGDLFSTVLRMPPGSVPAPLLPPRFRFERRDGSYLFAAVWVDYREGSVLTYREFMVAAIQRLRPPLRGTILRIWVDSPQSQAGGRQLWDIPKDLAQLDFARNGGTASNSCFTGSLTVQGTVLAAASFGRHRSLPLRYPFALTVLQQHGTTQVRRTLSTWSAPAAAGPGELTVPSGSELAFLNRGRQLTHLSLPGFRTTFGRRSALLGAPASPGNREDL